MSAPARLHLGLLNESGAFGRVDGGLGVALDTPAWRFAIGLSARTEVDGIADPELQSSLESAIRSLEVHLNVGAVRIAVSGQVPSHVGLGSKTSLLMAVSAAMYRLVSRPFVPSEAARLVRRGGTSGVGVNLSDVGGFLCDAGHRFPKEKSSFAPSSRSSAPPPTLLVRMPFPYWIVHFRFVEQGLSGEREARLFTDHCPIPLSETQEAIARTYGQLVPSLIADDIDGVQDGLRALQYIGLKKYEWQSQATETLKFREYFELHNRREALGLSSMGPTMFVFTTSAAEIVYIVEGFGLDPLHLTVTRSSDRGATIHEIEEALP